MRGVSDQIANQIRDLSDCIERTAILHVIMYENTESVYRAGGFGLTESDINSDEIRFSVSVCVLAVAVAFRKITHIQKE